jgi:hypothetical protein
VKKSADIKTRTCNKQVAMKKYANMFWCVRSRAYQLFYCRNHEMKLIKNPLRQFFSFPLRDKQQKHNRVEMQQVAVEPLCCVIKHPGKYLNAVDGEKARHLLLHQQQKIN